jgi:FAD dependent oxidoreductase
VRIRIAGAGLYGCHLAVSLLRDGHDVTIFERADRLFAGASGNMPARAHLGFHYPRSKLTRAACQKHVVEFKAEYGEFMRAIPTNIYAIAETDSLVDFGTYCQIMEEEIQCHRIPYPIGMGLQSIEGALLTFERHILIDRLRDHFAEVLAGHVEFGQIINPTDGDRGWNLTLDCTFGACDATGIDRYEACLTLLLEGPTDKAVTIMDGPFPSLYPWDEAQGLSSLTSAKWTVLGRCNSWAAANGSVAAEGEGSLEHNATSMVDQMAFYYPRLRDEYRIVDYRFAIRAMPRSAADARLADVAWAGDRQIRVRAGKLDAIFHAEREIKRMIEQWSPP